MAEVTARDIGTGCLVSVDGGLTPDLLRLLFRMLNAADWILLPAMKGNPAIVRSPGLASRFRDKFPEVVCRSPEELGTILSPGLEAAKRYRDHVVGERD